MGLFSYLRFFIGLFLSIEIIRLVLLGEGISQIAIILSIAFIALAMWWFISKIILKD